MCEKCTKKRRKLWNEIRDVLNFKRPNKGPISAQIAENIEKYNAEAEEDAPEAAIDAVRADLILEKCVEIMTRSPGTPYHQATAAEILLVKAQEARMREAQEARMREVGGMLSSLFGGDAIVIGPFEIPSDDEADDE